MAAGTTAPTGASVDEFVTRLVDPQQREDCRRLIALMRRISGHQPVMWGTAVVGFAHHRHRHESGRESTRFTLGFAPRHRDLAIYFGNGLSLYAHELANLGPHRAGRWCLYLKRLDGIDLDVLTRMLEHAYADISARHGEPGHGR